MKSSLTSLQKKTLTYIVGTLLALALTGGMLYDLNRRSTAALALKQEVERKEAEAASIQLPDAEEESKWAEQEKQLKSILLSDQQVPEFQGEVTRIAYEYRLQRLGINNEDKVLNPDQPISSDDAKLLPLGIRRYVLVTLKFQGEYPDMARFLAAISKLPRPVEFHTIDMRRNPPWIDGSVILKVYKREPA